MHDTLDTPAWARGEGEWRRRKTLDTQSLSVSLRKSRREKDVFKAGGEGGGVIYFFLDTKMCELILKRSRPSAMWTM
jgi:hypothetical protein